MAIALAYRIAIALAPAAYRASRYVESDKFSGLLRMSENAKRLLADHTQSDEVLSELLTRENGYPVYVTTITGDFEVRRVHLEFSVTGASLVDEDVRVITFHHIKLSGTQPVNTWDPADFTSLQTAYTTWWDALKLWYAPEFIWTRIAFYRAGPAIVPPQPPAYTADVSISGTQAGRRNLPPQVALSVTEQAGQKKNWGRFYMPAPVVDTSTAIYTVSPAGRVSLDFQTAVANATDILYETALTANLPHVVYRPLLEAGRPTHDKPDGSELPERPANAQTVDQLQVDDVFDVIRRRRWERPTLRLQRAIGSAAASTISASSSAGLQEQGPEDFAEQAQEIPASDESATS